MAEVLNRVNIYAKYKGITKAAIERAAKLPNGSFKTTTQTIRLEAQSKISAAFPDLNIGWLLTGEGEMLKSQPKKIEEEKNPKTTDMTIDKLLDMMAETLAQNSRLISVIERMQGISPAEGVKSPPLINMRENSL